jgi:hypothetical protein
MSRSLERGDREHRNRRFKDLIYRTTKLIPS